jgi:hypothetical protein
MSEVVKKKAAPRKTAAKKNAAPAAETAYVPATHADVEQQAYLLWLERGRHHGGDAQDWLQAEQQLQGSLAK